MILKLIPGLVICCLYSAGSLHAGVVNPDCTPEKAAKGAAMKATVGVGGRCDFEETAKDSLDIDDKGPREKNKKDKNKNKDKDKDGLRHHDKKDKD